MSSAPDPLDVKAAGRLTPDLCLSTDAQAIARTVESFAGDAATMAEAIALLNAPALSLLQRQALAASLAPAVTADAATLAAVGRIGFSFPLWRFLAQGAAGMSLFEAYGLRRLTRENDLRDASLPDPARDQFGVGYWRQVGDVYIEYRRAYILLADLSAGGGLIIRNSSWFFGRDRLPWAAGAVSGTRDVAGWQNIGTDDLTDEAVTRPLWQSAVPVDITRRLLAVFDAHEKDMQAWLAGAGFGPLHDFLQARLDAPRGKIYLASIAQGLPPWFPVRSDALTADSLARLRENPQCYSPEGYRLALLSGPSGDRPVV